MEDSREYSVVSLQILPMLERRIYFYLPVPCKSNVNFNYQAETESPLFNSYKFLAKIAYTFTFNFGSFFIPGKKPSREAFRYLILLDVGKNLTKSTDALARSLFVLRDDSWLSRKVFRSNGWDGASISRFTGTHRRLFLFVAALVVFMYEQILEG